MSHEERVSPTLRVIRKNVPELPFCSPRDQDEINIRNNSTYRRLHIHIEGTAHTPFVMRRRLFCLRARNAIAVRAHSYLKRFREIEQLTTAEKNVGFKKQIPQQGSVCLERLHTLHDDQRKLPRTNKPIRHENSTSHDTYTPKTNSRERLRTKQT